MLALPWKERDRPERRPPRRVLLHGVATRHDSLRAEQAAECGPSQARQSCRPSAAGSGGAVRGRSGIASHLRLGLLERSERGGKRVDRALGSSSRSPSIGPTRPRPPRPQALDEIERLGCLHGGGLANVEDRVRRWVPDRSRTWPGGLPASCPRGRLSTRRETWLFRERTAGDEAGLQPEEDADRASQTEPRSDVLEVVLTRVCDAAGREPDAESVENKGMNSTPGDSGWWKATRSPATGR